MEEEVQKEKTVTTSTVVPEQQVVETTKVVQEPAIAGEHPQKTFEKKKTIFRAYQLVWYILAIIEVLLAFRMVLKALGANPTAGFATFVYALSAPFAGPFVTLFNPSISPTGSVFEWSTIIAAAVYAIVAFGIVQLLKFVKPVSKQEVEQTVDKV